MGTVIEGEWDEVFDVVKKCLDRMRKDCDRITASIKIDYRKSKAGRIKTKIESVERKLKRKLTT